MNKDILFPNLHFSIDVKIFPLNRFQRIFAKKMQIFIALSHALKPYQITNSN